MVVTAKICAVHDDSLMQEAVIGLLLCLAGLELHTLLIAHLHCPDTREREEGAKGTQSEMNTQQACWKCTCAVKSSVSLH